MAATELLTVEKAAGLYGTLLRDEIGRFTNELAAIKEIKDDDTLERAKAHATALNKVVNKVDKKRKELKAPYLAAGKVIDEAYDLVVGNAEQVIADSKEVFTAYIDERESQVKARQKQIEEEERKKQQEIEQKKTAMQTKLNNLMDYCKQAGAAMEKATANGMDALKEAYVKWVLTDFPDPKEFGDYESTAIALQNKLKQTKDLLKDGLGRGNLKVASKAAAKADYSTIAQQAIHQEEEKADIAIAETSLQMSIEAADNTLGSIADGAKTIKWNWMLDNLEQVPQAWLTVNEEAVEEYIRLNKDTMTEECVVNGIRFIPERKMRLG